MPESRAQVNPGNASDIEMLVELVREGHPESGEVDAIKEGAALSAMAALTSLACDTNYRKSIALAGGIEPLVDFARAGNEAQQAKAAAALKMLAFKDRYNKKWIGEASAIAPLIALLAPGKPETDASCAERSEMAAAALCNLAHEVDNRKKIAEAGGIAPLVALLAADEDASAAALAGMAALNNLAVDNGANRVEIAKAGAITPLVRIARLGTEHQRKQAELALQNLAFENDENLVEISKAVHEAGLAVDLFKQRTEERVARARKQAARDRAFERANPDRGTAQHEWLVAAEAMAMMEPNAQHEWLAEAEMAADEEDVALGI